MKLRGYFYILVILLLVIFGITFYQTLNSFSWKAVTVEVLILVTLGYLIFFYGKTVRPLQNISSGMDLLREQDFSSRLREVGQFEADRVVEIFNKMMEQLKNERLRLREQNEFLDLLIKASPMGVIVLDYDHQISELNPAALKIMGLKHISDVKGYKLSDVKDKVLIDLSNIPLHETRTISLHDGTVYKCTLESFIDRGFPRHFYLIESLTEEVRRAEKKAYEKVIRMIAHEVNNSTAGITSMLDTVGKELEDIPETQDLQQAMQVCVERCYSMSRFITNFADVVKIPKAEPAPTDLNGLIDSMSRFMEVMCLNRNIKLTFHPDKRLQLLHLDASLFEQILLNIIKNSTESIEKDGEIIIKTDAETQSIEIADNGKGISKEIEHKLFNPFFSSKPAGQGIGLLFIREVLSQHNFNYSLRTYPDGWTRFVIRF
ncbi:MAG: ATP-binding protein [Bacteroidales bacterium]|jgi:nitrogen fixation/metabolism regulation signal transduction histidine kinase|nr:ATP-binding protein [Bacteroidales bacterium]MDD2264232.1 ATP-binding protein [Bacteroidales bacterium]MDD2831466.1 ATP-binding protein [Bacteroidales bacterium]MDD3208460.1 ATP-binding protein [Bacteroidales bacterium]MDD3697127.1 ATP-binding protein [Bacteroidales bacterium]